MPTTAAAAASVSVLWQQQQPATQILASYPCGDVLYVGDNSLFNSMQDKNKKAKKTNNGGGSETRRLRHKP